jgi:hypothetical protein
MIAVLFALLSGAAPQAASPALRIVTDRPSVPMGRTVVVRAVLERPGSGKPQDYVLLPFVNGRRWGSHERPAADGSARFLLPLPNPGPARIQVIAVRSDTGSWTGLKDMNLLLAGRPMPERGLRSNALALEVTRRQFTRRPAGGTLFSMQWEPWFTPQAAFWTTSHAVPVMGFYESYDRDVTRQHILWFMDLGVDFIMADWSNHIWGKRHWDERPAGTETILHATQLALEVLASMRDEGLPVPKFSLLTGLSNGPPAARQALNEEHEWVYRHYVLNPRFRGLWQEYDGKPLIMPLDTGAMAHPGGTAEAAFRIPFFKQTLELDAAALDALRRSDSTPLDDRHFTIRWISSQNQATRHHELGYWSWMDGSLAPVVTMKNGNPEAVTVTPALFAARGWTGEGACGRRDGQTYVESFRTALASRPRVVFLHQFQEFAGQQTGQGMGADHGIYVDSYSVELSDDLEPVSLTAPGYRGDRGGWGYRYLNLTQALMGVYRGEDKGSTVLAVGKPYVAGGNLRVEWSRAGRTPAGISIAIDGRTVAANAPGGMFEIPLSGLARGPHRARVTASGSRTIYPLSFERFDQPLAVPVPVSVEHTFTIP